MLDFFCGVFLGACVGIIIGITDCKKKFGIPKGAKPNDGNASNADY